ncbi:MAG: hypothetical protein NE334_01715 [Lentisphaeraceae bacterium]|nr:hypothetical protein [Lentisphaeraceae bacterium]
MKSKNIDRLTKAIIVFIGLYIIAIVIHKTYRHYVPRTYVPGLNPDYGGFPKNFFIRRNSKIEYIREKSKLKMLGTTVGMYFSDRLTTDYPSNPQDFKIDKNILRPLYLQKTDKELPEDWKVPNNWQEFNNSLVPFAFVQQGKYESKSDKVLFVVKPSFNARPDIYQAVFEDGHVGEITLQEAKDLLAKAKVQNEF